MAPKPALWNETPRDAADSYWKEGNGKRAEICRQQDVMLSCASSKLRPSQGMRPHDHISDSSHDGALKREAEGKRRLWIYHCK